METEEWVLQLDALDLSDLPSVGGKNASLGEMIGKLAGEGVRVPGGFATTASAYRRFVAENELEPLLRRELGALASRKQSLHATGSAIREAFRAGKFPAAIAEAIRAGYRDLARSVGEDRVAVAVRSSATAEDLPEASFAGQQETYLNVRGEDDLLEACRNCYASLFTDRAISYREANGYDPLEVALSVGVQQMIRADQGGAGVLFSLDTETGFPDLVILEAAWGLGENVVKGTVNPDEYRIFKPLLGDAGKRPIVGKKLGSKERMLVYQSGGRATTRNRATPRAKRERFVLSDDEILQLARWAVAVEQHYGKPMDMEWGRDGEDGPLYLLQARPETVQSRRQATTLHRCRLTEAGGTVRVEGLAIGERIATGRVRVLESPDELDRFEEGEVLVAERTDPDWVPLMKKAAAIVTDHGGRTSHAAIVSRELGVTAVIGTGQATAELADGEEVTVSCAEGETGRVYAGRLAYEEEEVDLRSLPRPPVDILLNLASPGAAFRWWRLPVQGVGLARMEFIINSLIQAHPMALLHPDRVEKAGEREQIARLIRGHPDGPSYFVDHLSRGLAAIAASRYPQRVIVRLSDFKTNEYAGLLGGSAFEPAEENPMLGFRGASRYYSEEYREGFALECAALRRAREELGFRNLAVMIPFARTPEEVDRVLAVMAEEGLVRGEQDLRVYLMCEIPSNVFRAEEFARRVDGFSIGSNDLTQLILGVDRDSDRLSGLFRESDEAVKRAIREVIREAHRAGITVGICGQAPSDDPEFAAFLVEAGIDSLSLNPDSVVKVMRRLGGDS
jgi:pyruvate,water dikinase